MEGMLWRCVEKPGMNEHWMWPLEVGGRMQVEGPNLA